MKYSIEKITTLIGARRIGTADAQINWLLTDSRSLCFPEETLFFALKTARNDGHKYIEDLYRRGVRNFVVTKSPKLGDNRGLNKASSDPQPPNLGGSNTDLKIDIYAALSLLKPDERTCVTLQMIDGYDIAGIAKITEMKEGTVKSHLSRGKEKMANYLKQNGYG